MNEMNKNFYFKALIKTFKIHKRFNDVKLKKLINNFGKYSDGDFCLPHLIFSSTYKISYEMINTYCDLIAYKYAKDVASYYIQQINEGDTLHSNNIKFTLKELKRLANGEEKIMQEFTNAIKDYQIRGWINHRLGCSSSYLYDDEFYEFIYEKKI